MNKNKKVHTNKGVDTFNKAMYAVSIFGALFTLPQLLQIWSHKQAQGVSLATWVAYACLSALWLIYGLLHKQRQLILSQTLLVVLDIGVVVGVIVYH